MTIINAYKISMGPGLERYTEAVPQSQINRDRMILEKLHAKASKELGGPWQLFGGTLKVGNRRYQVC